ncbi:internal scaffolding protein [Microviridae sp.]|nr:internal scaffolding protein [Microviridae sp.]
MSKQAIPFKTAYGPKSVPGIDFTDSVSLTKQADKDSCDINVLMDQYSRTGILAQGVNPPDFGHFSDGNDFQDKLNCVLTAQENFMALPASVRTRFGNDPAHLLNFLSDVSNRDEAVKLGLVAPPVVDPIPSLESEKAKVD